MINSFCPHCNSAHNPALKKATWSCGVRFNDACRITKKCYKRQLYVYNEHLKLQEEYISEIEEENYQLKEKNKRQNEAIKSLREMYAKEAKP